MSFVVGDYTYNNDYKYIDPPAYEFVSVIANDKDKISYGALTNSSVVIDGVVTPTIRYQNKDYIIDSLNDCFSECENMVVAPTIPVTVDSMVNCFYQCVSLTTVNGLHNCNATNLKNCFDGCGSLATVTLPRNVKNLRGCFHDCTSIVTPPSIPDGVWDMSYCFSDCMRMTSAPDLSQTKVEKLDYCFARCDSLINPPSLPNTVKSMVSCFNDCRKLRSAPRIPDVPTGIPLSRCFGGCDCLSGDCYIDGNSTLKASSISDMFSNSRPKWDVPNRIYLHTRSPLASAVVATSAYTYQGNTNYSVMIGKLRAKVYATRRLLDAENAQFGTTNGVRIDMEIDGQTAGVIDRISNSNIRLFDSVADALISFPTTLGSLRAYAIVDNADAFGSHISFYFDYMTPDVEYITVQTPCVAQPCDIKVKNWAQPVSCSDIQLGNIKFPYFGCETVYDALCAIYDFLGMDKSRLLNNKQNGYSVQHYVGTKDNTKHINTSASSVGAQTNAHTITNLQEVINSLYNRLNT